MSLPRRDFMKSLGISIGSILLTGNFQSHSPGDRQVLTKGISQASSKEMPSTADFVADDPKPDPTGLFPQEPTLLVEETPSGNPTKVEQYHFNDPNLPPRARLRHCWFYLSWLARRYDESQIIGEWARDLLISSHRKALVELIVVGKMCEVIARDIQKGFDAAVNHVQTSNAPIVCYD